MLFAENIWSSSDSLGKNVVFSFHYIWKYNASLSNDVVSVTQKVLHTVDTGVEPYASPGRRRVTSG